MPATQPVPFRRLNQLFFISLVGANLKLESIVKNFSKECDIVSTSDSFFYYEYLLHQPYFRDNQFNLNNLTKYWYFAPFILRLSKKTNVSYNLKSGSSELANKKTMLENVHIGNLRYSLWMREILKFWHSEFKLWKNSKKIQNGRIMQGHNITVLRGHPVLEPHKISLYNEGFFYITVPKYKVEFAREKYEDFMKNKLEHSKVEERITGLSGLIENAFRQGYLHTLPLDLDLPTLVIPLATHDCFFGEVILSFPGLPERFANYYLRNLAESLYPFILDYYLPAVMIAHEHFLEDNLEDNIDNLIRINHKLELRNSNLECTFNYDLPWHRNPRSMTTSKFNHNSSCIEASLNHFWESLKGVSGSFDKKKDLMIFQKYLIASPIMINLLKDIIQMSRNLQLPNKPGSSLLTALITGSPGSGKDTIPELIRAFSNVENGFFSADIKKINLAALKPDSVVTPILSGVELGSGVNSINFQGILSKVAESYKDKPLILVLDELNSMHIDVQGVLLRFLEYSEVVKLGQLPEKTENLIKCMVIGIMNEDPDAISRDEALDFIEKGQYLGGLLKDVLYEQFIRMRRLRPDLKYRLVKGGSFNVGNMEERRNDIPILFFVWLKKEVKNAPQLKKFDISFDIDLVDELLSPTRHWPGNVRQIQALAKKTIEIVQNKKNKTFNINRRLKTLFLYVEDLLAAFDRIQL